MSFIGGPAATCIVARESAAGGLMPLRAVAARLKVSRRELYRIRKTDPTFPQPEDLGYTRTVLWRSQAIGDWCRANLKDQ
jgi:predicted DNA-binding transcriptional regulator AlpA